MTLVELADGSVADSSNPAVAVYNAAVRGIEARTIIDGRPYTTADLPRLRNDAGPQPYWLRIRFP